MHSVGQQKAVGLSPAGDTNLLWGGIKKGIQSKTLPNQTCGDPLWQGGSQKWLLQICQNRLTYVWR